jgi:hypothetical protein
MREGNFPAWRELRFARVILVECPACGGRAEATLITDNVRSARRLTCNSCWLVKTVPPKPLATSNRTPRAYVNIVEGLALWLKADTRHGDLYAFNFEHLEYIETYVRATIRSINFRGLLSCNRTIPSRLPLWVKQAKNREEVLKIIDRMRRR